MSCGCVRWLEWRGNTKRMVFLFSAHVVNVKDKWLLCPSYSIRVAGCALLLLSMLTEACRDRWLMIYIVFLILPLLTHLLSDIFPTDPVIAHSNRLSFHRFPWALDSLAQTILGESALLRCQTFLHSRCVLGHQVGCRDEEGCQASQRNGQCCPLIQY